VAHALGIPSGVEATHLLAEGRTLAVDLGRASFPGEAELPTRFFVNNADVGIGARVASGGARFKRAGGKAAFALSSIVAVLDPRPWRGTVQLDEAAPTEVNVVTVVVALGPYTGGGMHIAPGARMEDGLFDVVTIDAMAPRELLVNLPRIYAGTHLSHPAVRHTRARSVHIVPSGDPPVELDGEIAGRGAVDFRILPGALRIHVGKP
jgi:diacylglycerol kinase (ATP)